MEHFRQTADARVLPITTLRRLGPHHDLWLDPRLAGLQEASLFRGLSTSECGEVLAAAQERQLVRRETLFREGDPVQHVSLLAGGRLKLTQLSPAGAEVILKLKGRGEVIGGLGVMPGTAHPSTAQALELCQVLLWEMPVFEALTARIPEIERNAVRILAGYLNHVEERFRELATEQVATRLARMLVRLLDEIGRSVEGAVSINLTREELAQMTGTTLFTVSRLLSGWEDLGLVAARREAVLIYDAAGLGEVAESD